MQTDLRFDSNGIVHIDDCPVPYRAISKSYSLCKPGCNPEATIFSFTYLRSDVSAEAAKSRPVIFAFNGGPGSSSVWLHLGLMGPTRVKLDSPIIPPATPPFSLENNPHCPLDIADVVMIDPVGTGFARLLDQSAYKNYYGVDEDAYAIARFIEHWLIEHDRWNSPKYLMGESYGTVRCGALVSALMGGPFSQPGRLGAIPIDGVILMGSAYQNGMNPEPIEQSVLNLPTYAATRWYHKPDTAYGQLSEFIEQAFTFAQDDYIRALFMGNRMAEDERKLVVEKLARFTGLDEKILLENNLRLNNQQYITMTFDFDIGLYDSRYTTPHSDLGATYDTVADDGAMGLYTPAFVGAMNGLKLKELGIDCGLEYNSIMFADVNSRWNFQAKRTPMQCLTAAMRRNKDMRVFFVSGCYDLVTTMGYVRYVATQGKLPMERVRIGEYESGHMPYLGEESAEKLANDLRGFIGNKEK